EKKVVVEKKVEERPVVQKKVGRTIKVPKRWMLYTLILVFLIIAASILSGYMMKGKEKKVVLLPYIDVSKRRCDAGESIILDATRTFLRSNVKSVELHWIITPERYRLVSGNLTSDTLEVYFTHSGTYNITLLAQYKDLLKETSTEVEVNPITVNVERLRWGDEYRYYTEGNTTVEKIDGIDFLSPEGWLRVTSVALNFRNPSDEPDRITIRGEGGSNEINGFGQMVKVLNFHLDETLEFSGEAIINNDNSNVIPISGQQTHKQDKFIDLYYQTPVKIVSNTFVDASFLISGQSVEKSYRIEQTEYPTVQMVEFILSIDSLKEGREFHEDESGLFDIGEYTYQWRVLSTERVFNTSCFKVEINIQKELKDKLGINDYSVYLWIGSLYPVPLKVETRFKAVKDSTTYDVKILRSIRSYTPGSSVVLFGQQSAYHQLVSDISTLNPKYSGERREFTEIYPPQGSMNTSIPEGFTLEDVFSSLEKKSQYRDFMNLHPGALLAYANISEEASRLKKWEILIKDPGSDDALKVLVFENSLQTPIITQVSENISIERDKPTVVYTFSAIENLAKECFDKKNVTLLLYGKTNPGPTDDLLWKGLTFRFTSYYPLFFASINDPFSSSGVYYSFEKKYGEETTKGVVFSAESGALQSCYYIKELK
ncbi:MAG: hypothetical protein J7L88_06495, partial [Thermoplasmata archaeon]|nr:hypothetical protein [Thermoplasmata archaeon]